MIRSAPVILVIVASSSSVFLLVTFANSDLAAHVFYSLLLLPERFHSLDSVARFIDAIICLFGYAFLHVGFVHLLLNMLTLLAFGSALTRLFSQKTTLFIYLATVVASAIAPILSGIPALGASGGVSGIIGALCAIAIFQPSIFNQSNPNIKHSSIISFSLFWLALNIVMGLFPETLGLIFNLDSQLSFLNEEVNFSIAWNMHIIGFLVGLIISAIFSIFPRYFLSADR